MGEEDGFREMLGVVGVDDVIGVWMLCLRRGMGEFFWFFEEGLGGMLWLLAIIMLFVVPKQAAHNFQFEKKKKKISI